MSRVKRIAQIFVGTRLGLLTAALPMVLSFLRFGADSYTHGFMTCLMCWWVGEQVQATVPK